MPKVDCCLPEDIPAVVDLHVRVYGNPDKVTTADRISYYQTAVYDHPWYDEEIPALVFRSDSGEIQAFLGVLTHRMQYKGAPIRMAIPHNLMVDPGCGSPMVAIQLARAFLDGAQDLVYGDGANDNSRKLLEALGAEVSHLYSMNWLCILRPFSYVRGVLGARSKSLKPLTSLMAPFCALFDSAVRKFKMKLLASDESTGCSGMEVGLGTILSASSEFSRGVSLSPDYTNEDIKGFERFLGSSTQHSPPVGMEVRNQKGTKIGAYLYRVRSGKYMEVLVLWGLREMSGMVYTHLLAHALKQGVISIEGRMDPRFFQSVSDHDCLVKRRCWTIFSAKDAELLNVINRGDVMLSAIDGEFVVTHR